MRWLEGGGPDDSGRRLAFEFARLHFDDLQLENRYSLARSYGQSTLAILYFTLELARRLEKRSNGDSGQVVVNAVDPGPVASNIGADNPGFAYRLARPMIRRLFPSAKRAARTAVMVAADSELANASGGYYRSRTRRENPPDFDAGASPSGSGGKVSSFAESPSTRCPDRSAISTCLSPRQTISGSGLRFLRSRWALR